MKLLTPEQIAETLSISRSSVRRLIIEGTLPAVCLRSGRRKKVYRVREEVLERWVAIKEREGQRKVVAIAEPGEKTG
jgi:excisionase family DNA binding protein